MSIEHRDSHVEPKTERSRPWYHQLARPVVIALCVAELAACNLNLSKPQLQTAQTVTPLALAVDRPIFSTPTATAIPLPTSTRFPDPTRVPIEPTPTPTELPYYEVPADISSLMEAYDSYKKAVGVESHNYQEYATKIKIVIQNGTTNTPEFEELVNGWRETALTPQELQDLANQNLENVKFTSDLVGFNRSEAAAVYKVAVRMAPLLGFTIFNNVYYTKLVRALGMYDRPNTVILMHGLPTELYASQVLIHEGNHGLRDRSTELKQYLTRQQFINFIVNQMDLEAKLVQSYIKLGGDNGKDEEEILGNPLEVFWDYDGERVHDLLIESVSFATTKGIQLPSESLDERQKLIVLAQRIVSAYNTPGSSIYHSASPVANYIVNSAIDSLLHHPVDPPYTDVYTEATTNVQKDIKDWALKISLATMNFTSGGDVYSSPDDFATKLDNEVMAAFPQKTFEKEQELLAAAGFKEIARFDSAELTFYTPPIQESSDYFEVLVDNTTDTSDLNQPTAIRLRFPIPNGQSFDSSNLSIVLESENAPVFKFIFKNGEKEYRLSIKHGGIDPITGQEELTFKQDELSVQEIDMISIAYINKTQEGALISEAQNPLVISPYTGKPVYFMYLDGKGSTSPLECLLTPSSGFDGDFTSSVAVVSQLGVQVYNGSTAMFCDETNVFGLTPIYIGSLNLILNERKLKIEDTTSFGKFTKERSDSEELSYIIKHIVEGDQLVPYIIVSKYGSEEIIEKFKLGIIP